MADAALTLDGLGVDFSGFKAVSNVSTVIEEGELRVLLGANGAGKTTLMDLISGRTQSTEGRVFLFDQEITNRRKSSSRAPASGGSFRSQACSRSSRSAGISKWQAVLAGAFSPISDSAFRSASRDRVEEVLDLVALRDVEHETAANLSHGQTQWLELGLLIVQAPKVLLLDEPTAGMTAGETQKTARIINDLKGRHTLIVVEHDMAFVREIAERITVLHLGQIIAEGGIGQIENDPKVREAYLGSGGIH